MAQCREILERHGWDIEVFLSKSFFEIHTLYCKNMETLHMLELDRLILNSDMYYCKIWKH